LQKLQEDGLTYADENGVINTDIMLSFKIMVRTKGEEEDNDDDDKFFLEKVFKIEQ